MQSNKSVHFEDDCNSCITDCTECLFNSVNDNLNRRDGESGLYGQSADIFSELVVGGKKC